MWRFAAQRAPGHVAPESLVLQPATHAFHDAVVRIGAAFAQQRRHACAQTLVLVGTGVEDLETLAHELFARGAEHLAQRLIAVNHGALARKRETHGGQVEGQAVVDVHAGEGFALRITTYAVT